MRQSEPFDDFEAIVLREQDDGAGMALPFAFADVRDAGFSTAGGDPVCLFGDREHVIVKAHDDAYGWEAVARDRDRFEQLEELELAAADAQIARELGTVCHQARFKTPGGPPSDHAAAWNQARNKALVKYLLEPEQLGALDDLVAALRALGNTVDPMRMGHGRLAMLRDYFLTAAERAAGPGLGADRGVWYLDRSIWICAALCDGVVRSPRDHRDDDPDAFLETIGDPNLHENRPDALYWMWWSVFRGTDEMTDEITGRCAASADPLIRSSVALADQIRAGRDQLGAVDRLSAVRSRLRAL